MTRKAVHEVRIPAQTPPGIQVPHKHCGGDYCTRDRKPHFWNALDGVRRYCDGGSK